MVEGGAVAGPVVPGEVAAGVHTDGSVEVVPEVRAVPEVQEVQKYQEMAGRDQEAGRTVDKLEGRHMEGRHMEERHTEKRHMEEPHGCSQGLEHILVQAGMGTCARQVPGRDGKSAEHSE